MGTLQSLLCTTLSTAAPAVIAPPADVAPLLLCFPSEQAGVRALTRGVAAQAELGTWTNTADATDSCQQYWLAKPDQVCYIYLQFQTATMPDNDKEWILEKIPPVER